MKTLSLFLVVVCVSLSAQSRTPKDEVFKAMDAGTFSDADYEALKKGADEDYFSRMDKGITLPKGEKQSNGQVFPENTDILYGRLHNAAPTLTKEQLTDSFVKGRNNWMLFTGGNDRFWDVFNHSTLGGLDFIKTISNHPEASVPRSQRWEKLGLVNEPCFSQSEGPREDRYGLWLDTRDSNCPDDPFENAEKYPGVKIGARGEEQYVSLVTKITGYAETGHHQILNTKSQGARNNIEKTLHEVGSSYGYATGVIGLRLFTNPDFGTMAAARWDSNRYYNDPDYYNDPKLVKPYRVAMACAFCHVGPSVTNPPKDFNNPQWENLSSTIGSQYFWVDRIFFWNYRKLEDNFIHQLLHTQRPGTLDTSLISSDQINNPRTMNAIYDLRSRVKVAFDLGHVEKMMGEETKNKQFSEFPELGENSSLLNFEGEKDQLQTHTSWPFFTRVDYVTSPRVLKDGADSVGVLGALNRVYVNIGLYSEEWLKNFIPVIGTLNLPGLKITPFEIKKAESKSGNWNANTEQTPNVALYLLGSTDKDKLKDVPNGQQYLQDYNSAVVNRGKEVFAQNCASCHSSKLPQSASLILKNDSCIGEGYLECWQKFWNHTQSSEQYKHELAQIVKSDDFLSENYLSTELRVPVSVVGSQVCSSVAANAIKGDIWDNFSSESYKSLASVKDAIIYVPSRDGSEYIKKQVELAGGGRGYLRPPSLISAWSTAPYFNNNTMGPFRYEGTLQARMESFTTSIDWLLNPERRGKTSRNSSAESLVSYNYNGHKAQGIVDVFSVDTYLSVPMKYVPAWLRPIIPEKWTQAYPNQLIENQGSSEDQASIKPFHQRIYERVISFFAGQKQKRRPSHYENQSYTGNSANYVDEENNGKRLYIGPIPQGVPVSLISNMNFESSKIDLIKAVTSLLKAIEEGQKHTSQEERLKAFMSIVSQPLLKVSKCSDMIVNKGHYFGTEFQVPGASGLSDEDKKALTEFIKHF